eukprot:COSAG05_NODE_19768_length_288_cov_0.582011_1_plen_87_part_01
MWRMSSSLSSPTPARSIQSPSMSFRRVTGSRERPCAGVWPLLSLHDEGDCWAMSQPVTRRKDMEGDWIERAGFGELKDELMRHKVHP